MEIPDILKEKSVQLIGVGITAFVSGAGVGYILGQKRKPPEPNFSGLVEYESMGPDGETAVVTVIAPEPEAYDTEAPAIELPPGAVLVTKGLSENGVKTLSDISAEVDEKDEANGVDPDDEDLEESSEPFNVFGVDSEDWDIDAENAKREATDGPYVIHETEYLEGELGYSQSTLTYYTGDDKLCGEDNVPVFNNDAVAGELLFGHGSNEDDIVYVRNEKLKADYQILRFHGSYEQEILGLQAEAEAEHEEALSHSNMRFRRDED